MNNSNKIINFEIIKKIGEGSFSIILKVKDKKT